MGLRTTVSFSNPVFGSLASTSNNNRRQPCIAVITASRKNMLKSGERNDGVRLCAGQQRGPIADRAGGGTQGGRLPTGLSGKDQRRTGGPQAIGAAAG